MRAAVLIAAGGFFVVPLAGFALPGGTDVRAQPTTIQVGDVWFCSDSFANGVCETIVSVGDAVTWSWAGSLPHTTTACSGSDFATCGAAQGWSSDFMTSGTFSHTFTTAGTFYYKCLVHPGPSSPFMRGKMTVVSAPAPTPTPSPRATATPSPPATPTPSPQPSPASPTPTVTVVGPAAVPAGGGAPSTGDGAPLPWWLAVASGALLVVAAAALGLRGRRL